MQQSTTGPQWEQQVLG